MELNSEREVEVKTKVLQDVATIIKILPSTTYINLLNNSIHVDKLYIYHAWIFSNMNIETNKSMLTYPSNDWTKVVKQLSVKGLFSVISNKIIPECEQYINQLKHRSVGQNTLLSQLEQVFNFCPECGIRK